MKSLLRFDSVLNQQYVSHHQPFYSNVLMSSLRFRYANGAMALGSSYLSSNGNMSLVVMVTAEVPADQLKLLSKMWQVIRVDPVACNHKLGSKVSAAVCVSVCNVVIVDYLFVYSFLLILLCRHTI